MKTVPFRILLMILAGVCLPDLASGSSERLDAIRALKSGGGVLMIRHANAPGSGDPANFKIGDCATQRNLDDLGRAQARAIGVFLRHHEIVKVRLYSSQWCRCLETARLMNLGAVQPLPALNSFAAMTGEGVSSGEGMVLQLKNGSLKVVGRLDFGP